MGKSQEQRLARQAERIAARTQGRPLGEPVDDSACIPTLWQAPAPQIDVEGLPRPEPGWVYGVLLQEDAHFKKGHIFLVPEHGRKIYLGLNILHRCLRKDRMKIGVPYLVRLDPERPDRPRGLDIKAV